MSDWEEHIGLTEPKVRLPIVGNTFTVATTVDWLEQVLVSVTVTVYVPPDAVVTDVTEGVAIALNGVGPFQTKANAPAVPVPLVAVALNVSVEPAHTAPPGVITDEITGNELTLTVFVTKQPVAVNLYVIVGVLLPVTPVTVAVVVAVPLKLTDPPELVHVPPASASDKVIDDPTQTALPPEMAAGLGFTVAATVPRLLHLASLTVTVYVPVCEVAVAVREGAAIALSDPGPGRFQEKAGEPPPDPAVAVAEKESAAPIHTAPLLVTEEMFGSELTVNAFVVLQPVVNV